MLRLNAEKLVMTFLFAIIDNKHISRKRKGYKIFSCSNIWFFTLYSQIGWYLFRFYRSHVFAKCLSSPRTSVMALDAEGELRGLLMCYTAHARDEPDQGAFSEGIHRMRRVMPGALVRLNLFAK